MFQRPWDIWFKAGRSQTLSNEVPNIFIHTPKTRKLQFLNLKVPNLPMYYIANNLAFQVHESHSNQDLEVNEATKPTVEDTVMVDSKESTNNHMDNNMIYILAFFGI